jgi:cytochrome P450
VANQEAMQGIVRQRRAEPQDDLITRLAEAEGPEGELFSVEEVAALARIVLFGAVDSVVSLIAQAAVYLDRRPDERQRLIDDPALIPVAIEEFLRYFSPGTTTARTVRHEPAELSGRRLVPGDRVVLNWLAANHDPDVFDRPDEIVLDRTPNRHLAFGAGIHKCIGLHFGRVEAKILLEQILARFPDFRVVPEELAPIKTIGLFSGYWNVAATFTPGPRQGTDRRPDLA